VSERSWCDLVSYSGGLPLAVIRAYPDETIQKVIVEAATDFERRIREAMDRYRAAVATSRAIPTKRIPREIQA
jgi:hypothetical protein